ncbi:MAG: IS66 family insertion sequence element accessory protein TnpB, partial [Rubrivivax sp.]|nr:IS66 family insertion sequence element accessory protein TnpB [Rubrivivax sp.]
PHRRHSAELKAKALTACNEPGASIAAVALGHGLNAHLVRNWLAGRGLKRAGVEAPLAMMASTAATVPRPACAPLLAANTRFLPIEVDTRAQATRAERLLACVVQATGAAHAHHGYLFANARATRMKLLVHDGFGVWCAARRLNAGRFVWPRDGAIAMPL